MNLSDDEEAPAAEPGKRKIGEVEPKARNFRYLTSSSVLDSFGDVKALSFDKFGALRDPENERPNVYRRIQTDSSTGSFTPLEQPGGTGKQGTDVNDSSSTWSKYIDVDWENEGTSSKAGIIESAHLSSHSSAPISCTLHERSGGPSPFAPPQQTENPTLECDTVKGLPGDIVAVPLVNDLPMLIEQAPSHPQVGISGPEQNVDKSPQHELAGGNAASDSEPAGVNAAVAVADLAGAGSLPTALSRHSIDHCRRTSGSAEPPPLLSEHFNDEDLPRFARNMESSSSEEARQSTGQYPVRINYRFASATLEASLLQRMEERQRLQDAAEGEERVFGHVISPEDLIWGSVKHYCGMVLDRETRALLGTAVLFMPPDQQQQSGEAGRAASSSSAEAGGGGPRPFPFRAAGGGGGAAAWVTGVKVVEGRTEVLIKSSKGAIHVAQLLLTSTTLGLALFSVRVWQGTFALAFLSRVAGPASLPHRLFVDALRSDRVYVIGYEEPWESEVGTIADVRVRPGRIVDAGRQEIVEIDFNSGQLGGSINSPAGFRGGLVARADGHLVGVVTGEVLGNHPTNIDFCSAFNVYSLLEEL